jgi:hypothetical protein
MAGPMYDESRLPFNRIIAFGGPYISVASGALASWLVVHVHVLGLGHVKSNGLATAIEQGIVFTLTLVVTWLGHDKWLSGHHLQLKQAADTSSTAFPDGAPPDLPGGSPAVEGAALADTPPGPGDVHAEPGDTERLQAAAAATVPATPSGYADSGAAAGDAEEDGAPPDEL